MNKNLSSSKEQARKTSQGELLSQKIKISEYLTQARNRQLETFERALSDQITQSLQVSQMPTVRVTQRITS